MTKVILATSINKADRDMLRELNDRIEQETRLKLGVSLIIGSLVKMLHKKGTADKIIAQIVARKRDHMREVLLQAAKRELSKIEGIKTRIKHV